MPTAGPRSGTASKAEMQSMNGPFAGLRVIDLTTVIVGPYTSQLLGDLGADVIKIEAPGGDMTRNTGPAVNPGMSSHWNNVNRNKRSLVLDLKNADGKEAMRRLLAGADVFVHNMRPEPLARLGFSYADVAPLNPRLVYCGISGFGRRGRYSGRAAYDDVIQGASGLAALQGRQTGDARYVAMLIADKTTALFAAYAVAGALYARQATGTGQEVEVPMFESMVSFNLIEHLWGRSFEPAQGTTGSPRHAIPLRRPYPTKDGFICLLPGVDRHWRAFFAAAGRPELIDDPRFCTRPLRTENHEPLFAIVQELLLTRTTAEWAHDLAEAGVPCMPIKDLEDLIDDPHLADVGFFRMFDHPTEGKLRLMDIPYTLSATPGDIRRLPPRIGEHSREVLAEAGFSDAEIDAMAKAGVTELL